MRFPGVTAVVDLPEVDGCRGENLLRFDRWMPRMDARRWRRLKSLRWLLVLSLWQGPVPVWHAHDTLADAAAESTVWLASHLERHHASIDPFASITFGWHVHFEVPDSEGEPSESPGPGVRLPAVVAVGDAALADTGLRVIWHGGLVSVNDSVARQKTPGAQGTPGLRRYDGGFFSSYAATLSLPLRLGVARC